MSKEHKEPAVKTAGVVAEGKGPAVAEGKETAVKKAGGVTLTTDRYEQIVKHVSQAAAVFKSVCGVGNNAAWLVVLLAHDHIKKCDRYKGRVRGAFNHTIREWHTYENNLIYARKNRMFHVADMTENVRRRYGDITDREYYDFWASIGSSAYVKTKPLITSLHNKYRLSLLCHEVKDADNVAWGLTAASCLSIANKLYQNTLDKCIQETYVKLGGNTKDRYLDIIEWNFATKMVTGIFGQFSLDRLLKAWNKACELLSPDSMNYTLDDVEKRNIEWGITQLLDAWIDPTLMCKSIIDSVDEYEEVFATKGFKHKAIREISDVQDKIIEENDKQ